MAKKATTVEDVVLGEAKAGNYEDMVAIVSVIDNRSRQLNKSYKDVVSVRSEFNAYGKELPDGVDRFRSLARKALEQVRKNGPVHNATFYSTPATTRRLPKGLSFVTATAGHRFFSDPQFRSIRTVDGFVRPTVNVAGHAPETLYDVANPPTPTPRPDLGLLADATPIAGQKSSVSLPSIGPVPDARPADPAPSILTGLTRSGHPTHAPNLDLEERGLSKVIGLDEYNPEAQRSVTPTSGIIEDVQRAVTQTFGPGYGVGVVSGQEPVGMAAVGALRNHPPGLAIDFDVVSVDPAVTGVPANQRVDITAPEYTRAVSDMTQTLAAQGHGIGFDPSGRKGGYMNDSGKSPGRMHAGGPGIGWGGINRGPLAEARSRGFVGTPDSGPVPMSRDQMPARSLLDPREVSAPVERALPGGTPKSILGDISMPGQQPSYEETVKAAQQATSSFPSRPAPELGQMPAAPVENMPARSLLAPSAAPAPSVFDQSRFNAMTQDISMPGALPDAEVAAPATPPEMIDLEDRVIGQPPVSQPPAPNPVAQPMAAPVAAPPSLPPAMQAQPRMVAPQQAPVSRPSVNPGYQPAAPSASGQDVWDGRAMTGVATNGNQLTRNPDGTVSMTSAKYGYTETMNPDGSYRSTTAPGLFGIDRAARSLPGGGQSQQGQGIQVQAPQATTGSRIGQGVRGVAGGIAGSMAGGLLGPIGSLLGAAIGNQIAQGKNPFGREGLLGGLLGGGQAIGGFPGRPDAPANPGDGSLTDFGEAAARGEIGGRNSQAGRAARGEISGLF